MTGRLLLLALLAYGAWKLWQHFSRRAALNPPLAPSDQAFEPMARCSQCGIHLPRRALSADGRCGRCS